MKFKDALIVLMKMERRAQDLADLPDCHIEYTSFIIKAGHAVEGVRTNGYKKRSTIIGALRKLDSEIVEVYKFVGKLMLLQDKFIQEAHLLRKVIREFPSCRGCNGDQGISGPQGAWEDCEVCEGYGMIIPEKEQDQEKKWFELHASGLRLKKTK